MEYQQTPPPPPPQYDRPVRPKTWLVESIVLTVLCCTPFSIVGIIYAAKVNSLYDQSQYEEAKRASSNAKMWTLIGLGIGLITTIIYIVFIVRMAMSGELSEMGVPGLEGLSF